MKTLKKSLSIVLSFLMVFTTVVFFNPIKADAIEVQEYSADAYYYYPSGTKFISELKLVQGEYTFCGSATKDGRKEASNNTKAQLDGYTIVGSADIGDGTTQMTANLTQRKDEPKNWTIFTFLGYKTSSDITTAYTGMRARHDGTKSALSVDGITYNVITDYHDLNKSIKGDTIYLMATKDIKAGLPITNIRISNTNDDIDKDAFKGSGQLVLKGDGSISDLNQGTSGTNYIYIAYDSALTPVPNASMTALKTQIDRYTSYTDIANLKNVDSTKYNTLVSAFETAVTIHNAFNNKFHASTYNQTAVDNATKALKEAFEAFKVSPDYSALNAKVAEANTYLTNFSNNQSIYTVSSAAALSNAVAAGTLTAKTFELKNYTTVAAFVNAINAENNSINSKIQPIEDAMQALETQITFDTATNGGTNNVSPIKKTVGKNSTVTIDLSAYTATKPNYDFVGWSTDPNATSGSTGTVTVDLGTTFYAIFAIGKYTVIYNGNGATEGTTKTENHELGEEFDLPTGLFKKTGYRVLGWHTDPNATTATWSNGQQDVSNLTSTSGATVNLYVIWTPWTYTIKFDGSGAEGTMANQKFTYDTAANLRTNAFTKEGGIFLGWATEAGGAVVYTDEQLVNILPSKNNDTITLYAVWDIAEYTVEYKGNGATEGADYSQKVEYSTNFTLPTEEKFKKTGYNLLGWSTDPAATVAEYEAGATVKNLTATDGATVTLYAVWEEAVYTVKFVFADNTEAVASYKYGDTVVVPANTAANYDDANHYTYAWPTVATTATGNATYVEIKTGTAHDLQFVERLEPACKTDGYETYACACGYSKTTVVPATGHTYVGTVTPPTCTDKGYTTFECSVCDEDTYVGDYVDALGHTAGTAVKEKEVKEDCGNDGYYESVVYCTVCKVELSRTPVVVPATGNHTWGAGIVTDPTCTEPGGTKYVCSVCSQAKYDNPVDPLGHNWAATTYEFAADGSTCTATRVCQNDTSHVETAEATITSEEKTAPTCTVDGWTTYTATFAVEWATTQTKDVQDIPAIKHDWAATTYDFAADGSACTAQRICNNDNNHVETLTATIAKEVKVAATCTEDGTTTYTATFAEDWAETQILDVVDIPALTHKWAATTYDFAEDGSACTATRICQNDNNHVETAEAVITSEVTLEPNCTDKGNTTYTAEFDVEWAVTQTLVLDDIAANGHKENRYVKENVVEATCATEGSYDKVIYCWVCEVELSRTAVVVPATGDHNIAATRENVKEPTCGVAGSYDYVETCLDCGQVISSRTEVIYPTGKHTAGETVVENEVAPNCGTAGSYDNVVYCTVCEKEISRKTVVVPAEESHTPTDDGTVTPPTCTAEGYTTYTCSKCGCEYKENIVAALGHTAGDTVIENNVPNTDTTDGSYDKVVYCTVCGEELSRETVIVPASGHSYVPTVTAPTCTKDGYTTYTCECGDSYETDIVPALGHSFTNYEDYEAASCYKDAKQIAKCDRCDATDIKTLEGTYLTHSFADYVSDNNATCGVDGTKTAVCEYCNEETHTMRDKGSALSHTFTNYVSDNNAACKVDGTKTAVCDNCKTATDTVIDEGTALKHNFNNYVSNNDATCTKDGTMTSKCALCDETFTVTDEDSALGHDFTSYVSNNDATCTRNGTKTSKCTRCDAKFTIADVNTALGHNYTVKVGETSGDCQNVGTETYKCERCDAREVREGTLGECVLTEVKEYTVEPTCTTGGIYDLVTICAVCKTEKARTEDVEAPALDHDYEFVSSREGTCLSYYTMNYKCSRCDAVKVENGDQKGSHSPKASKQENVVLPTCADAGSYDMVTRCRYCNDVLKSVSYDVPALGHSFTVKVDKISGTCQTNSKTVYKCQYCNETETVEGLPGTHKMAERQENVVAATCGSRGSYDKVEYCSICNDPALEKRTTVSTPKLQHKSTDVRVENEIPAQVGVAGSYDEVVFCEDCNSELSRVTVTIPAKNNNSGSSSDSGNSGSGSDSGNSGSSSGSTGKMSIFDKLIAFFKSILSIFGL